MRLGPTSCTARCVAVAIVAAQLAPEEARRFFGKPRATLYLTGFSLEEEGPQRRRVVVDPDAKHGYRIEAPASGKRKSK